MREGGVIAEVPDAPIPGRIDVRGAVVRLSGAIDLSDLRVLTAIVGSGLSFDFDVITVDMGEVTDFPVALLRFLSSVGADLRQQGRTLSVEGLSHAVITAIGLTAAGPPSVPENPCSF